ncbi:hypothetical protein Tco_0326156, partial [Tanacetum coccineum]
MERGDNLEELFGPDPKERPAGKQRASKKQKSVDTSSAKGSTGGSQSEPVSSLVSRDYRRKCDAAERAYEVKRDKELAMMLCRELEFLMLDPSTLPPEKQAIIEILLAQTSTDHIIINFILQTMATQPSIPITTQPNPIATTALR